MRSRYRKALFGATTLVTLASVVIAGAPTAAQAADAGLAPVAGPARMAAPPDLAEVRAQLLEGLDASAHGGVDIDPANRSITLMVAEGPGSASISSRAARVHRPGVTVRTKKVARSRAVLEQLRDEGVWKNLPAELSGRAHTTQIDTMSNRVVVEVDNVTTEVRRALKKRFGDAVSVRAGEVHLAAGRYNDLPLPRKGGGRILMRFPTGQHYTACSAGFAATYQSRQVMVTAGHCAPYGTMATPTSVTNGGIAGEAGCDVNSGCSSELIGSYGSVWQTRYRIYPTQAEAVAGPLSVDLALITTSAGPTIYRQASETSTTPVLSFPGAGTRPSQLVGQQVCHSGATSWGGCGFFVQDEITNNLLQVPNGWVRFQTWRANSGNLLVCGGDSGGPVYTQFGSGAAIVGTVSTRIGATVTTIKGQGCSRSLGFTFWGQGRSVFSNLTPRIQ